MSCPNDVITVTYVPVISGIRGTMQMRGARTNSTACKFPVPDADSPSEAHVGLFVVILVMGGWVLIVGLQDFHNLTYPRGKQERF